MKRYIGKAVHCKTERLANEFLAYASSKGWEWYGEEKLTDRNRFKHCCNGIYYIVFLEKTILFSCSDFELNTEVIEYIGGNKNE